METDSPPRLSGMYPVTLPLLIHCVYDSVALTPWHGLCLAKEWREQNLKGQDFGVYLAVQIQGEVMSSDSS